MLMSIGPLLAIGGRIDWSCMQASIGLEGCCRTAAACGHSLLCMLYWEVLDLVICIASIADIYVHSTFFTNYPPTASVMLRIEEIRELYIVVQAS